MSGKRKATYTGVSGRDTDKVYHLVECDVRDNFKIGMLIANAIIPQKKAVIDGENITLEIGVEYQSIEGVTDWLIENETGIFNGSVSVTTASILELVDLCLKKHEQNGNSYDYGVGYDTGAIEEKSTLLELFFACLRLHSIRFSSNF
jgi:hypothetical protein